MLSPFVDSNFTTFWAYRLLQRKRNFRILVFAAEAESFNFELIIQFVLGHSNWYRNPLLKVSHSCK